MKLCNLKGNHFLLATKSKGFWLLKYNNESFFLNKIEGNGVEELTKNNNIGLNANILNIIDNKYLVATYNKGFWLLEFDNNTNKFNAGKIQGEGVEELVVDSFVANNISMKVLSCKVLILVGTNNKGFWLLEFDNNTNKFNAGKIQGEGVEELTTDSKIGDSSCIQDVSFQMSYLVGTNNKGFWLLEPDYSNNTFKAGKIQGKGVEELTTDSKVASSSKIQPIEQWVCFLVATYNKGFWFVEFEVETNNFVASEIRGEGVQELNTHDQVGSNCSIRCLGRYKYLVGTIKGFWLLKYDWLNDTFDGSKIQGEGVEKFHEKNIGFDSSIELLEGDKYLVEIHEESFWLLDFDTNFNTFKIKELILPKLKNK